MPIKNNNKNSERSKEDIFEEQDKQIIKTTEETINSNSKDQRKCSQKFKEEQITGSLNEIVVKEESKFQTPEAITSIKQDAELSKKAKHKKMNGKKKREYHATILLGYQESLIPQDLKQQIESDKMFEVMKAVNKIMFKIVSYLLVLSFFIVIPFLMVSFGVTYLTECPAQNKVACGCTKCIHPFTTINTISNIAARNSTYLHFG
ncbi:uncharacterized protein LOC111613670 isoform X2 [Centruroides sculpturatus]|uniref:uncharacterized protein LOC111613670 isoform X2 n=1 Tax=Centruroides sculpturatus TaxID=218467 RepID=UPI000C6D5C6B|nr:uncharacterized protein LOC111613670 isoform X2 [Centruroides sculpturatus]